jgi:hypothetical protein
MNVRAARMTLARRHSIIVFMMSALASPASVVRGPLPIHLDTLVNPALPHLGGREASRGRIKCCCGGLGNGWTRHILALAVP